METGLCGQLITSGSAPSSHWYGSSESVVGWLDSPDTQINLRLDAVMGGMDQHVQEHRSSVRVSAALLGRQVPGALELLGGDLWKMVRSTPRRADAFPPEAFPIKATDTRANGRRQSNAYGN